MATQKTSLILNNLVELSFPIQSSFISLQKPQELVVTLPFVSLVQKIEIDLDSSVCLEDFSKSWEVTSICSKPLDTEEGGEMRQVIDFKKEKIDWRFKTRMRSNSNEMIERSSEKAVNSDFSGNIGQAGKSMDTFAGSDSDNQSFESEELDLKTDSELCFLVCGVSNSFHIVFETQKENETLPIRGLKIHVWPCFRMPTSGSAIPLINTSFLFATKKHNNDRLESDFLVALSLINARKFIQASEKFRRIEQQLLTTPKVGNIQKAMQIELIIGESMNQHSQISEKIFAFQRAVLFSIIANQLKDGEKKEEEIVSSLHMTKKTLLKQDEAPRFLMMLQPHLVRILIQNVNSQIEAVRLSAIKSLEYLVETLGCSLDFQIVSIITAIIQSYPTLTTQPDPEFKTKIASFFQDQQILAPQTRFFSLADMHSDKNCFVKDVATFHQSYIQSSKNHHNHILESLLFLVSSMSTNVLLQIYNDVIQKALIQDASQTKLPLDLKTYLLKFAEKIVLLCQGDIFINVEFVQILIHSILQTQNTNNETYSSTCLQFWHTYKVNVISKQTKKGKKAIVSWLYQVLVLLSEKINQSQNSQAQSNSKNVSKPLEREELQKLLIYMELIELLLQSEQQQLFPGTDEFNCLRSLHTDFEDPLHPSTSKVNPRFHQVSLFERPSAKRSHQMRQALAIEMSVLIRPMIFWLQYCIAKQERLPLFKIIWRVLFNLLNSFPSRRRLDLDCISVILPVLEQVDDFCQSSSPKREMLQFLQIVLTDLKTYVLRCPSYVPKRQFNEFFAFLDKFVFSFAKIIPHNLHDEVFSVCELLLDIMGSTGHLKSKHMKQILNALVHKYTMRSKAYKKLMHYFITTWVLDYSVVVLEQSPQPRHEEQNQEETKETFQQPQRQLATEERSQSENQDEQIDSVEDIHSEHSLEMPPQTHQRTQSQGQVMFSDNNLLDLKDSQSNGNLERQANKSRQSEMDSDFNLFDAFCNETVFKLRLAQIPPRLSEQEQVVYEKLGIFLEMLKALTEEHICLQNRLLKRIDLKDALLHIFKQERITGFAVKILDGITQNFIKYLAPKNLYDHPIYQQDELERQQRQQNQFNFQPEQSEEIHLGAQEENLSSEIPLENLHATHMHRLNDENQFLPNDREFRPRFVVRDEIKLLNQESLILVYITTSLCRAAIEQCQLSKTSSIHFGQQTTSNTDAQTQLYTLNMLLNLFTNLLPTPTLQNSVTKHILNFNHDDGQRQPRFPFQFINNQGYSSAGSSQGPQQNQNEAIPDFETMYIHGYHETGQNTLNSFPFEFECWESKYLHARLGFVLKIWSFLEQTLTKSTWSNVRSLCIAVICQAVKIPSVQSLKSNFQQKLKQVLFPLLNNLLNNKDSDSKIGGLNILASFCGLSNVQLVLKKGNDSKFGESPDKQRHRVVFESDEDDFDVGFEPLLEPTCKENVLKVSEHLWFFRQNSSLVSLAIWQQVFDLQEDWKQTIREASTALIQLCAPQDSVKHFYNIKKEKQQLRFNTLVNTMRDEARPSLGRSIATQSTSLNKSQSAIARSFRTDTQFHSNSASQLSKNDPFSDGHVKRVQFGNVSSSFVINERPQQRINNFFVENDGQVASDYSPDEDSDSDENYFYMDQFSEEQIQSVLVIFKPKVKPMRTLWVDKLPSLTVPDCPYLPVLSLAQNSLFGESPQDQLSLDPFEDNMLEEASESQKSATFKQNESEKNEEEYLFKREEQPEQPKTKLPEPKETKSSSLTISENEDLGIIDLDNQEGEFDDFEDLDDDKLPILKNTYSKKCRPNNSKSVAIGSRSQGGVLKNFQRSNEKPLTDLEEDLKE